MTNVTKRTALALAASLALAGCGSGTLGTPASASGQTSPAARSAGDAATRNYSGEYAGTVKDSSYPGQTGKIAASFAQYQAAIGGSATQTDGSLSKTGSMAFAVTSATTFTGTEAAQVGTAICVYDVGGTYNVTTHSLKASYHAIDGCTGEHGTIKMKQQCYYARKGVQADVGGLKMC